MNTPYFVEDSVVDEDFTVNTSTGIMWSSYIQMPTLGHDHGNRQKDVIKMWNLSINATGTIVSVSDDPMSDNNASDCIVGLYLVKDMYPSNIELPKFTDVFTYNDEQHGGASHLDVYVRPSVMNRFYVIGCHKFMTRMTNDPQLFTIKKTVKFDGPRRTLVRFRDDVYRDGSYKNTKNNVVLIFLVLESLEEHKMKCTMKSRIIYYH